ncbi:Membrane protein insertase YidC 2 [Fusobacterium sp. DD29]|uniref:YidC/Oxa1 family membrane protein insertase n=1 Tax=unclassified Fusobacterium TaxID=2648384 RepID=UPI001B8BC5A3|nr:MULTISPECIES: YidC/Oxa1 family membrane protein insertase [unclassified Fusobacterium]MBR8701810.1 Membrane protein insertase YidC 2 [Fusobacterium sp. DD45]MBR8711582.1 Membrane protein insertase YidC 2 [Fusobacterium sp. DD28]MBR8750393.1 Membrane protein insertase YidC 2 [Fusobacterium sp. DD29]MBR8752131.1 Membrane protein insertase YidC 2 [Fusobacterium sp. DD26]MBR8762635.1 Membrane protein insertase YidC 2 [Fusobacterium sp. DD25]
MSYIYGLLKAVISTLLSTMHNLTGNFGVAIILATIVIRIVLLPLTLKQDKSMKNMKKLQPELEKIKEKYKNDSQMMNQKTMELYKENKVNPAGGCLPLLIQLPILWALFGVLRDPATVPPGSTFLWLELVKPDPYYILPILNGVVSFLQQKLMGSSSNPQMKNMMYMFPLMMVFISYKMPAGLQVYWLASSVAMVVQQYLIMKKGD